MKQNWEYTQGDKTSVKIHNAPGNYSGLTVLGGNSQFSLGWGNDEPTANKYQNSFKDQV